MLLVQQQRQPCAQSPQASWSAGGRRERLWLKKKNHWLFSVTKLRTSNHGNRSISAVKIPVPQSLSRRLPADQQA